MSYSKSDVIQWLASSIGLAKRRGDLEIAKPCLEGAEAALKFLQEEAKPAPMQAISKPEIDGVIERLETEWEEFEGSRRQGDIRKLLDYVKTAPLLPRELSEEALQAMWEVTSAYRDRGRHLDYTPPAPRSRTYKSGRESLIEKHNALYAHLTTPPKPRMIKEWCFYANTCGVNRFYIFNTVEDANRNHAACKDSPSTWSNVSPIWEREVPA